MRASAGSALSACGVASILVSLMSTRVAPNLVSMTRKRTSKKTVHARARIQSWRLQDAKARFSEVVRRAGSEGPQHVTVHGHDAVVIVDAESFRRMQGERTGQQLIDALQASPHREIDLAPARVAMPVRTVKL